MRVVSPETLTLPPASRLMAAAPVMSISSFAPVPPMFPDAVRLTVPEVEISSFVRTVVQADRMGTPIGEVLAVHAEDVRMDRMNKAERVALKAPIKILFPLIFFMMLCVAIVVGAPIFLQFMQQTPFGK